METQPFYCSWVLSSKAPSLAHFRNYLEDEGFEAPDLKGILPFGRHQGKSYAEVMSLGSVSTALLLNEVSEQKKTKSRSLKRSFRNFP